MTPDQIIEREKRRKTGQGQEGISTPESIIAREKSRQANSAMGGLYVGRDIQPDRASKVISLADRMNAKPDFVDTHLDELEQGEEEHKRNTLFSELPKLAKHFSDPYRAAESKDSIPSFAEIERAYIKRREASRGNPWVNNPVVSMPRSMAGEGVRMFGAGVRGIGELFGAYNAIMSKGANMVPGLREGLAAINEAEAEYAPGLKAFTPANYLRTAGGGVAELGEIIAPDEQSIADRVAGALGQIVGAVGVTLAAGPGATTGLFAGQGADQQAQALRRVGISPDERPLELASGASVTALSEYMRLGSIMRALPREARERVASNAFARIVGQAGEEAVQESVEGVLQNLITTTFDEEAGVFDGIIEQAGTAGTAAAIFQALVEVALPGRSRGQQAKKAAQELQDIRDIIEQSPVFQRSREAVEAFLNEAGEGEQVILHGEDLVELYQSNPQEFMQRMDEVGLSEADVERAMNGEDIEAEAAKILSVQEGFEDWVKIVKRAPEIPSLREMEREVEASDAVNAVDFRDAFERFQEQDLALEGFERVQSAVTEQLLGAGRGQGEAEAAGIVWGAFFRQLAEAGVDEGAVFERLGLQVNPKPAQRLPKPQEPQTLHSFVRGLGGIRESFGEDGAGQMRGEVDARLGERVPGLINNASGVTLDEIFKAATEEGGYEIRDEQELLDLIERDLSGERVYPVGEGEVYAAELDAYDAQFERPEGEVMDQAAEAGYEGSDRGEAAEWLRAKAKGLDMSKEARMARAAEMGFDTETVLYHGTNAEFDAFSLPGSVTQRMTGGDAIYLAIKPKTANDFAKVRDGSRVMGLYVRGNFWDFNNQDHVDKLFNAMMSEDGMLPSSLMGPASIKSSLSEGDYGLLESDAVYGWMKRNGFDGVKAVEYSGEQTIAIFDPSNIRSIHAAFDPDFSDSANLLAQSAVDLQMPKARPEGTGPGGRVLNGDIGRMLTERHMERYGRQLDPNNDDDYATMLESLLEDYREQMEQPDNGEGWYTDDINTAVELTSQIYPEMSDQVFRDLFLTVTALLSPQQKPIANWENAVLAMRSWSAEGRIELRKPTGKQYGVNSHTTGLQLLQHLIDTMGVEEALLWLRTPQSGRDMAEIRKASGLFVEKPRLSMYTPSELNLKDEEAGIYMFGPKVGDFMQNSVGIDQSAVTVDLWMARTYNRYIGRLMDVPPKQAEKGEIASDVRGRAERATIKRLVTDAANEAGIEPSAMQAALWYFEQRLYRNLGVSAESTNFSGAAGVALKKRGIDGQATESQRGTASADAPKGVREQDGSGPERAGDGSGRDQGGSLAPLEGAPRNLQGPIAELVSAAEQYASDNGIPLKRQAEYVDVDPERAARIAQAYEDMPHAPNDPAVQEAYANLIRQTRAQYDALIEAGYVFTFFDGASDPYAGNPSAAMRDLRNNKRMAVYGTYDGYGTEGVTAVALADNPMLADTGLQWPDQDGVMRPVVANDLFRAVHDAFGHGLEGASFRARGEENAWQAHVRLFTGSAIKAMTSETRGQNSWLNFGPYGETNRTAKVEDTVFAEQKTGLMPEWTWAEGRVGDYQEGGREQAGDGGGSGASGDGRAVSESDVSLTRIEPQQRELLFQRQGKKPRGSVLIPGKGVLSDPNVIVRLNNAKDKSTFMHESAHIFLELYAALEGESEVIAERMAAIRKWLKVEPGAKLTVAQHEKFAESFEAYLREGVAPSAELRPAFDSFRQWITDVYRRLRGQLRSLEPEARDIFDRMLATEAEIDMAQGQYVGTLSKVMQSIMSPEQVEKYAKHARKAGAVARDKLFKKHMAEVKRREKKAYKEEAERVEDMVRAQMAEWPEYKALAAFGEGGRSLDAAHSPAGTKLNTSENGEHPDMVAAEMGFASADEMFKAVAKVPKPEVMVRETVKKIMGDKYGDMLRDGTIEAEAMEAVFNEPTIRMMEAERNALAEKAAKQAIPLVAIRREAERRINDLPIDKVIKPGTYAITARNLHKKALRAAARGKWDDALRYTHQAMLQHEMARRAFKAREEIEKANRFLAKFAAHRKLDPKKIAPAYITKIRELMSLPGAQNAGDVIKALNEFADAQSGEGYSVVLPSAVVAGNDLPLRRRMTLEQFREFRDAVKNLSKLGRQQSEEAMQAFRAEAQELADEITQNYTGKEKRETRNPSLLENFTSTLRNFDALFMRWPFLIEALQGGKVGKIIEAFETPLRQALQDRNARREDMTDRLKDILKKHKITQGELNRRVNAPVIEDGNVRFSQVLSVALNMGTDQNRDRLVSDPSMNGDMAAIEAMLAEHLEQRHWDAAQDIWDLLNTMWADASAVEYRETGVSPKKVEASSVQTKFGTYRGGYYPLKYDRGFMRNTDLERQDVIEEWKQGVNGMATRASTNRGFLKERQQNVERPLRLDLTVILEHIDQVTNDIYMREPASRVSRLLQRSSIREAITRTQGKEYLKPLEEILKRSVVGTRRADNAFENLIRTGRVNASVALLGLNVTTAILAPISYFQTVIPRYGFAPVARGIAAYYGLGPFSMIKASKAINEKSVFMRERENTINREAHERIRKSAVQSRFGKIQGAGYWLMAFIEKHSVSGPLWMGIYNQALDQGKSEREAILEADRAVATTQGSGLELDQSVLQGGPEMERLLTFMWGYVSNMYGIARNDITKAQNFNRVFQVFKHFILLNVAASMVEALIRDGFGDEEDPYWQNTLMLMQRNVIGMVPGLSPFFSKYDSGPSSLQAGSDLSQAAERFFSAGHDYFAEGELDAEAVRSGVRAAGTGLGLLFGIPGTLQIARIEKTLAEDDDPTLYEALITGPDDDN